MRAKQYNLDADLGDMQTLTLTLRKQYNDYQSAMNDVGRAVNDVGGHTEASREMTSMIRALPIVERICGEIEGLLGGDAFIPDATFFRSAGPLLDVGTSASEVFDTYRCYKGLYIYITKARDSWMLRRDRLAEVPQAVTHSGPPKGEE